MPVWSEQERMIADSAEACFDELGGVARIRRLRGADPDPDRAVWRAAAAQGWIGMLAPEATGGLGMSLRDALVLMRAAARRLAPEPFAAAIAGAQAMAGVAALRDTLAQVIAGESIVLPVRATLDGAPESLSGRSAPLAGIGAADSVLILDDRDRLFLVPRGAGGVTLDAAPTLDGGSIGHVTLCAATAGQIAEGPALATAFRDLTDTRLLLNAAELSGLAAEALERTRAYLETRSQFGAPLASFQAVQQRIASVHVEVSAAEALVFEAARAFEHRRQSFAARAAFLRAGKAARFACKEAIQFNGAIGFTDECDIGLFLKRCMAITAAEGGLDAIPARMTA